MNRFFDIHNHLFNKTFLAKELLYRLMKELQKHLDMEPEVSRTLADATRSIENLITKLKRYSHAIRIFSLRNSIAIYRELDKTYKGEFILTPLTFDLTWCFTSSSGMELGADEEPAVKETFENDMNSFFEMVEKQASPMTPGFNGKVVAGENVLWKEYLKEKERFKKNAQGLMKKAKDQENGAKTQGIFNIHGAFDGWEEQIRQITDLKNHPDYKDKVYPFLAIDPRRPGISEYARANVGKGKLFAGIKLYSPNGYSPTDPLLFGPDGHKGGIYAFCEEEEIPVTAHNSDGGFATLSKSVMINGLIHKNGQLHQLNNELLTFENPITHPNSVYERAVKLNHPLIWEQVVKKYPGLILNLAHFGGGEQLESALDNPGDETLWSNRIIALLKNSRYKVYTDVSCYTDFSIIKKFVASPVYEEIKGKILYGSDYTLLLLFEDDFNKNVQQFKDDFGTGFETIADSNPRNFLKSVIP